MSANLEAKKQVVSDIVEKLKNAECMIVVSYSGLTVEQVTELRKQCREANVHYCVLKNRLVNRALQELNIEGLDSLLEGPNAFVFSEKDVTAGPKIISSFIEKNKLTSLEIRGGLMGTEVIDVKTIKGTESSVGSGLATETLIGYFPAFSDPSLFIEILPIEASSSLVRVLDMEYVKSGYESCYLTYQPMPVRMDNPFLKDIAMHSKWFANGAATKKMYLTVSHTENGGMNFSYHYQTVCLTEKDMELLYYYMMRILFKGIAEPDMSLSDIMASV